jgi:Flp pilus assembly protein TadD
MGQLFADKEEWKKAADHFEVAAELRPDDFDIRMALAAAHRDSGQNDAALKDLRIAQRMNPNLPQPWFLEGVLLFETGPAQASIRPLANAVARNPSHADAQYRLGVALMQTGQGAAAVGPLMNAVRLSPNSPEALTHLAWLLATHPNPRLRQGSDALFLANRADELTNHQSPEALDALAAAQAEQLQFDQAVETSRKASELATQLGKPDLARQIDARTDGYRLRRSVRDASLAGADAGEIAP